MDFWRRRRTQRKMKTVFSSRQILRVGYLADGKTDNGREDFQAEIKISLALFAENRFCVLSTGVMPGILEGVDEQSLRESLHGAL